MAWAVQRTSPIGPGPGPGTLLGPYRGSSRGPKHHREVAAPRHSRAVDKLSAHRVLAASSHKGSSPPRAKLGGAQHRRDCVFLPLECTSHLDVLRAQKLNGLESHLRLRRGVVGAVQVRESCAEVDAEVDEKGQIR